MTHLSKTARAFGVSEQDITGPSRRRSLTAPRVAFYFVAYMNGVKVDQICHIAGRSRDSFFKGIKKNKSLMSSDARHREIVSRILRAA